MKLARIVAGVTAVFIALAQQAGANCIAHQPANMHFDPPDLPLAWTCVTSGPSNDGGSWLTTWNVTNQGRQRILGLQLRVDFVDAFDQPVMSLPWSEAANIGPADSDAAALVMHSKAVPSGQVSKVNFYVLKVRFDDDTIWTNPQIVPSPGPTPIATEAEIRRMPLKNIGNS